MKHSWYFFPSRTLIDISASNMCYLTHIIMPREMLTLNTQRQRTFPFLQTVVSSKQKQNKTKKKKRGKYSTTLSLNKRSPSSEVRKSAGCQNDTQLNQTNKTSYASSMSDSSVNGLNQHHTTASVKDSLNNEAQGSSSCILFNGFIS